MFKHQHMQMFALKLLEIYKYISSFHPHVVVYRGIRMVLLITVKNFHIQMRICVVICIVYKLCPTRHTTLYRR